MNDTSNYTVGTQTSNWFQIFCQYHGTTSIDLILTPCCQITNIIWIPTHEVNMMSRMCYKIITICCHTWHQFDVDSWHHKNFHFDCWWSVDVNCWHQFDINSTLIFSPLVEYSTSPIFCLSLSDSGMILLLLDFKIAGLY